MFIFVNFVQKVDFEQSQLENVGVAFPVFYSSEFSSLRIFGGSCVKAPKVPLDAYFHQCNALFCYFCTKN